MMDRDAEIALARSAASDNISGRATVKILGVFGYQVATQGDNGFVSMVMRGRAAPTPAAYRDLVYDPAPICFNPVAARTALPYQELRAKLAMEGEEPDAIAQWNRARYPAATHFG
jgi:hypothetical protein